MKISKLFHWLYALVMLLPIFAIGTTCLISTFNMASKEESEIHYKYETNEVNTQNDLIVGNIYTLNCKDLSPSDMYFTELYLFPVNEFTFSCGDTYEFYADLYYLKYPLQIMYITQDDNCTLIFNSTATGDVYLDLSDIVFTSNIDFIYSNENILHNIFVGNNALNYISKCENIPIESVETHNLDSQEVFYRSVDKVMNSSLFNWSYDSFLAEPLVYIVDLFSMPSNSVIVLLLSYWLAISIIWLVFDLVMYVPLLVHRWIDKGVLE